MHLKTGVATNNVFWIARYGRLDTFEHVLIHPKRLQAITETADLMDMEFARSKAKVAELQAAQEHAQALQRARHHRRLDCAERQIKQWHQEISSLKTRLPKQQADTLATLETSKAKPDIEEPLQLIDGVKPAPASHEGRNIGAEGHGEVGNVNQMDS